jgi:hypothetical protein
MAKYPPKRLYDSKSSLRAAYARVQLEIAGCDTKALEEAYNLAARMKNERIANMIAMRVSRRRDE